MKIQWLSHSCFFITTDNGTRIMCDPCDAATGYAIVPRECDILTISHHHHDHDNASVALGSPTVIDTAGEYALNGVKIQGIATFHDDVKGAKRGTNTIFIIEADNMRIAHMGDIGTQLDDEDVSKLGDTDIMLMPVGGVYTLDASGAAKAVRQIKPKVVIPMHYKTAALSFELGSVGDFIGQMREMSAHYLRKSELCVERESLGRDRIIIMEHER